MPKRQGRISSIPLYPGLAFGAWTLIRLDDTSKVHKWICLCSCGKEYSVAATSLRQGQTTNCGPCGRLKRADSHGWTKTPTYKSWENMHSRCNGGPNSPYWKYYGKKGIEVCERWRDFKLFLEDMGPKPSGNYISVEREDGSKGYNPDNCVWATPLIQCNNTSRNRFVTRNGKKLTFSQWARELNISRDTLNGSQARVEAIIDNVLVGRAIFYGIERSQKPKKYKALRYLISKPKKRKKRKFTWVPS